MQKENKKGDNMCAHWFIYIYIFILYIGVANKVGVGLPYYFSGLQFWFTDIKAIHPWHIISNKLRSDYYSLNQAVRSDIIWSILHLYFHTIKSQFLKTKHRKHELFA